MDLTWWVVAIVGCVALAICIAAVVFRPMDAERRQLRPLANVSRLTTLPEYVRAARIRSSSMIIAMVLLVIVFAGAVIAASRPNGLPSAAGESGSVQPEDIMLCVDGPVTDPTASATLRYFAEQVKTFDTQRIGLTSPNRRVVPLTRDYQYAAAQLSTYAQPERDGFVAPVSYVDYAEGAEDLLALCLTGFPSFDQPPAQRRSVIYVGPDAGGAPDERRPALFTADRVKEMARTAGVQVNVIVTGADTDALASLARDTGGRSFSADSDVTAHLADISGNPPAAAATDDTAPVKPAESPDVPLAVALLAALLLAAWPVVRR
ncbi:MAG: hypothetical protein QOI90_4071 [Mycobacterium sp.]|nr:hypothetical protein [Mycobacterium sp.]